MKEIPKFYNCLDETLKRNYLLSFRGFKDRKSNFHNTVLCTVTSDLNLKNSNIKKFQWMISPLKFIVIKDQTRLRNF